jgi:hypothetical protein
MRTAAVYMPGSAVNHPQIHPRKSIRTDADLERRFGKEVYGIGFYNQKSAIHESRRTEKMIVGD